jgi:hypothetical protein
MKVLRSQQARTLYIVMPSDRQGSFWSKGMNVMRLKFHPCSYISQRWWRFHSTGLPDAVVGGEKRRLNL